MTDRDEVTDLLTRYTRAIDFDEWDLLDEVFTVDARIDYTSAGGIAGSRAEIKEYLARVLPAGFPRRQHVLGQLDICLDGDTGTVTAWFLNPMVRPDGSLFQCGGWYHHDLVRTSQGWRSAHLREETSWTLG